MNPILYEVPLWLEAECLILRCPQCGDGSALNKAVTSSLEVLRPWLLWATFPQTVEANNLEGANHD